MGTPEDLCSRCLAIKIPKGYIHKEYAAGIQKFVLYLGFTADIVHSENCLCCNALQDLLDVYLRHSPDNTDFSTAIWHLYAFWPKGVKPYVVKVDSPDMEQKASGSDQFGSIEQTEQYPALVLRHGTHANVRWNSEFEAQEASVNGYFAPAVITAQTESTINFVQVKSWIDLCSEHHHESCSAASGASTPGLRLINCQTLEIVDAPKNAPYIALSYVWGELTHGTSGISPESLPATIKDAVSVTVELGYSYLWVDRYCISQEAVSAERRAQIALMDQIYRNAEFTIIAASGSDPTYGLPGVSRSRTPYPSATIGSLPYLLIPADALHQIRISKWNTRGWTYQEAALSQRRLVFLDSELFFECNGTRCSDSGCRPLSFQKVHSRKQHQGRTDNGRTEGTFMPVMKSANPIDDLFMHLYNYTGRQLSLPEDILNGMLGIFQEFERLHESFIHIHGIPRVIDVALLGWDKPQWQQTKKEQFLLGLHWKTESASERRTGFPSWSWTGWFGRVEPRGFWDGHTHDVFDIGIRVADADGSLIEVSECAASIYDRAKDNTIGGNSTLTLAMTAHVVPVVIDFELNQDPATLDQIVVMMDNAWWRSDEFSLTQMLYGSSHTCRDTINSELEGIALGIRKGVYHGGEDQRAIMERDLHVVIMVVRYRRDGKAERFGLAEFENKQDSRQFSSKLLSQPRKEIILV